MDSHIHKFILAKGPNKRIDVGLLETEDGHIYFDVRTKTLIDFKTRHILKTNVFYSVETLVVLIELISTILETPEIKNKVLLHELANIRKFEGNESIVFKKETPKPLKVNANKNKNRNKKDLTP